MMDIAFYKRLARDGVKGAAHLVKALDWNPDQPRDPDGKFGGGGGGYQSAKAKAGEASNRATHLVVGGHTGKEVSQAHSEAASAHREAGKMATDPSDKAYHARMVEHHSESISRESSEAREKIGRREAEIKARSGDPWANTMELLK
jgi:hypothetical protein